ncbi:MAG: glutathione-disulfide reductase [Rhodobacteraceae bacterium]|jgi:glutathione reductase (NADPH)|nr:glutathione-disulfide reductase [Paracoccaceae bacterium]
MAFDYDLFVIGGGSGGVRAARLAAAECGAKVGLAEADRMGGTCVIRGCVPKKLMVFASAYREAMREAADYGWKVSSAGFEWQRFRTRLDTELDRLEEAYRTTLARAGVEIHDARAELEDPHTVRLDGGRTVTAKHILVATGGRPEVPERENAGLGITSNEVFRFDDLPASILIVGGGYIASEMACILNGLGVAVTQFYRGAQILRGFDDEARGHIAGIMADDGIELRLGTDILELSDEGGGVRAKASDGSERVYDRLLWATGRRPNTEGLGLDRAGVKTGRRGEVEVDRYSQTSVPSVFAVGDVTNRLQLTPVAIREAAAFVDTVFRGRPTAFDHTIVPGAVFTQPEYGYVGLTEEAAREEEEIEVYCTSFRPMQTAFIGRPERVMMKLIVNRGSRRVLGCHIVAPGAGEMIQLAAIAIRMGATKEQFDETCAVHPTMAEELVTMKTPIRTA